MQPVMPTPPEGARNVVFGADQPQYSPLPAAVSATGVVLTEWEPNAKELEQLLQGGRIRICMHTFGFPLNPIAVDVTLPDCGLRST